MTKERIIALDVFRGLTIAMMILVNTPGSWSHVYPPLLHAEWHGCTPTDLVFPFFLFAVGASMFYSMKARASSSAMVWKIVKRTLLIFGIGLLLNAFPFFHTNPFRWMDIDTWRIFGVLQRIALAYGVAAFLCYFIPAQRLILGSLLLLLLYGFVLVYFATGDPYSLQDNIVRKVDIRLFTEDHLYKGFGIPFDPEGLLGTLGAVVSVIAGFLVARYLQRNEVSKNLMNLLFIGAGLVLSGWILNYWIPINKPLWTPSYVLFTSGIAVLVLGILLYVLDVKNWSKWSLPFRAFGQNPLAIYVLSIALVKLYFRIYIGDQNLYGWLYREVFQQILNPTFGSLLFALFHVVVLWIVAHVLYRKGFLVKI